MPLPARAVELISHLYPKPSFTLALATKEGNNFYKRKWVFEKLKSSEKKQQRTFLSMGKLLYFKNIVATKDELNISSHPKTEKTKKGEYQL